MRFGAVKIDEDLTKPLSRLVLLFHLHQLYLIDPIKVHKGKHLYADIGLSKRTYDGTLAWLKREGYLLVDSIHGVGIRIRYVKFKRTL